MIDLPYFGSVVGVLGEVGRSVKEHKKIEMNYGLLNRLFTLKPFPLNLRYMLFGNTKLNEMSKLPKSFEEMERSVSEISYNRAG